MKLSKEDYNQLLTEILNSYPDITDLKMLVKLELEENLDSIAGGTNNKQKVFKLIEWAEARGDTLKQLIKALAEDRPQQQFFQEINNKLKSSIFNTVEMSRNNSQLIITTEEWNKLYFILQQINNNQLITEFCRQTLKNNQNDLLGNCFILSNNIDLTNLKDILLNKFPKRKDDIPTIIEFAEILSYEVDQNLANQLNLWTKQIAEKLNISLPTYSKSCLNNETYQYFLLITAIPKGKNQFDLESDLLSR